jgi:hypothetical protein
MPNGFIFGGFGVLKLTLILVVIFPFAFVSIFCNHSFH